MNINTGRLMALRAAMKKMKIEAVLLSEPVNEKWLSGFYYDDGYLLVTCDKAYVLTDPRYAEAAEKAVPPEFTVGISAKNTDELRRLINEAGVTSVAFEDRSMPYCEAEELRTKLGVKMVQAGSLMTDLREYKDETELASIREAQRITDLAFDHIIKTITPDMTEIDVAVELEFFMRKNGASAKSFDFIVVTDETTSLPHGVPQNRKLKRGFLTMDTGCIYNGYCSDMTRTVVLGKADTEMKKLYAAVKRAQEAALEYIAPGRVCRDVDKVARDILDAEYPGCFGHGLGHGVGMYIHEAPYLSRKSPADKRLAPGHVVTVEPGAYIAGRYGCRIEDMVFIGENGAEDITGSPKQLIELW